MTNEMMIYVTNLGKYNEGEGVGAWLSLPCTDCELENMFVEIGVGKWNQDGEYVHGVRDGDTYYEEWAIHDYQLPFETSVYASIKKLSEQCEQIQGFDLEVFQVLIDCHNDFDYAVECYGSTHVFHEPKDTHWLPGHVIREYYEQIGGVPGLDTKLFDYFDWKKYGEHLDVENIKNTKKWVVTS